jgi:hypothetical protein
LQEITASINESVPLTSAFHTLGDDRTPQIVARADYRMYDLHFGRVAIHSANNRDIEFDEFWIK